MLLQSVGLESGRSREGTVYVLGPNGNAEGALSAKLATEAGLQPVSLSSANELRSLARIGTPSCLILDLHVPGVDALDLQRQNALAEGPPVVFVTERRDICATVKAVKAGAVEVLAMPIHGSALLTAVSEALAQHKRALEQIARASALRTRFSQLTPRQREVFSLVIAGLRNKQAAWELGISEVTLQVHRGQIMKKMAARSFADLVRMGDQLEISAYRSRGSPPEMKTEPILLLGAHA